MPKHKFYSLWLALICIFIFILQGLFSGFTEVFVLNQQSFPQIWRFVTAIFLQPDLIDLNKPLNWLISALP